MVNSATERRPGRRPGAPATRAAILESAREAFVASGYRAATIRGIAQAAGVDPALVMHFFGNKEGLFAEAMRPPFEPAAVLSAALATDPAAAGTAIARTFLEAWESSAQRRTLLGLVRSAVSEESAAMMLREGLLAGVERSLNELGADRPALRASLISSQLIGVAMARYMVRARGAAEATPAELAAAIGPTLQRYINGPLFEGGTA